MYASTKIFAVTLIGAGLLANAGHAQEPPCGAPAFRQFDFWVGNWNVYKPDGTLVGENRIEREYSGCLVHENYSTPRGYVGQSLNAYDATRRVWQQTWVDNQGTVLNLVGGLEGASMVLRGTTPTSDGGKIEQRITWTPNADGSVRQLWEAQDKSGAWAVKFDGRYVRK